MTITRREFLGGMLAGLGAALARKLPKVGAGRVIAEDGDGLYEVSAEPIECGVGRGSPHIFDNFGFSVPGWRPRISAHFCLRGDYGTLNPGDLITYSCAGEYPLTLMVTDAHFDGEYTTIEAT